MKSLQEYIKDDLNIYTTSEYNGFTSFGKLNGLEELLTTSFVVENSYKNDLPEIFPDSDHKRVIDYCIIHLLKKNLFDNILTFGYGIGKTEQVNNCLHCFYTNSNVSRIKSPQWHQLHRLIGTHNFVNLLINFTVIQFRGGFSMQVIGNRANRPQVPPSWYGIQSQKKHRLHKYAHITLKTSLQKKISIFKGSNAFPIHNDINELIDDVFQPFLDDMKEIRKSKIMPLMKKLLFNHTRIKYWAILNNICPTIRGDKMNHLTFRTPVTQVNRFIIILIEKLVPIQMFGSKRNKSKIFHFISILLRLPLGACIPLTEIMANMKIQDFAWLTTGQGDITRTRLLVTNFIFWLFEDLVIKIIATFFYCTEVSSNVEILFFRHDAWEMLSAPFLRAYFNKYLVENKLCENHKSYLNSTFNHSRLRLVPKKANGEFRVLAIPQRGSDTEESSAYVTHYKYIIYPVQCVLDFIRKKRRTHFNKIRSQSDIVDHIKSFKKTLLKKYGYIPKLSFMKFDIESCYDSFKREKAIEIINHLLSNESGFFVRSQSFLNPSTGSLRIRNVVNGSRLPKCDEIYIDNVRTVYLTKQDVLEVLRFEFYKTVLSFNGKCYLRRDGLFQGSRLSALVVDLVYDDLLEMEPLFKPRPDCDTTILRLADDFLIISSDASQVLSLQRMSQVGFPEYGAKVKADKMALAHGGSIGGTFQFCALEISLDHLDVWKKSDSFNIPNLRFHSTIKTYQKLRNLYELRFSYGTVDRNANGPLAVLYQIHEIGDNIAKTFVESFKGKRLRLKEFWEFILNILASSHIAWKDCPQDIVFKIQIRLSILNSFLEVLIKNVAKFDDAIRLLVFEINKCVYMLSLM